MGKIVKIKRDTVSSSGLAKGQALDPRRFDALVGGTEKLWGLACIARFLGVSESTVRRWAVDPDVPIYKPQGVGTYFALRSELCAWLRGKS
ncbi:MAG: DNA-binding protein [Marinovum algicola]|uniref:helix-turn-helix transcriptional regulator n=1 Tax=Roseobacteraceae TaxID=2854170 RepID=UPI0032EC7BF1